MNNKLSNTAMTDSSLIRIHGASEDIINEFKKLKTIRSIVI